MAICSAFRLEILDNLLRSSLWGKPTHWWLSYLKTMPVLPDGSDAVECAWHRINVGVGDAVWSVPDADGQVYNLQSIELLPAEYPWGTNGDPVIGLAFYTQQVGGLPKWWGLLPAPFDVTVKPVFEPGTIKLQID